MHHLLLKVIKNKDLARPDPGRFYSECFSALLPVKDAQLPFFLGTVVL